jgi:hypothetical protein
MTETQEQQSFYQFDRALMTIAQRLDLMSRRETDFDGAAWSDLTEQLRTWVNLLTEGIDIAPEWEQVASFCWLKALAEDILVFAETGNYPQYRTE